MAGHSICPWWAGYFLVNPLRRLIHNPGRILKPHVRSGMTVLEPGPGMGFFTLELARLVGPSGRVIAVDVEPRMIAALQRRARRSGLASRIDARVVPPDSMGLADMDGTIDFVLAFAVVHEMPGAGPFFSKVSRCLKSGGEVLLAEPTGHVDQAAFDEELAAAASAGLTVSARPEVRGSVTALLRKPAA